MNKYLSSMLCCILSISVCAMEDPASAMEPYPISINYLQDLTCSINADQSSHLLFSYNTLDLCSTDTVKDAKQKLVALEVLKKNYDGLYLVTPPLHSYIVTFKVLPDHVQIIDILKRHKDPYLAVSIFERVHILIQDY